MLAVIIQTALRLDKTLHLRNASFSNLNFGWRIAFGDIYGRRFYPEDGDVIKLVTFAADDVLSEHTTGTVSIGSCSANTRKCSGSGIICLERKPAVRDLDICFRAASDGTAVQPVIRVCVPLAYLIVFGDNFGCGLDLEYYSSYVAAVCGRDGSWSFHG